MNDSEAYCSECGAMTQYSCPGHRESKYTVSFTGRKLRAIGEFYLITTEVAATSEDSARMKLYDTYDHIMGFKVLKVEGSDHE